MSNTLPSGKFLVVASTENMIHYWLERDIMIEARTVAKIGEMVKKIRKEQKVTQVQLAQLSNVGYRFVAGHGLCVFCTTVPIYD